MKFDEYIRIIEAIMFAVGEPITPDKLAEASGIEKETVVKLIDQLERRYNVQESALKVIRLEDAFQIAAREEYAPYIKNAMENKRQTRLSPAALEVLAVVAYNQPVTKAFVEQVRGADSSGVMNTLVERGLIAEAGRLELPGRPLCYKTTDVFLRCFKLDSLNALPPLPSEDGQLDLSQFADAKEFTPEPEENIGEPIKQKADENSPTAE